MANNFYTIRKSNASKFLDDDLFTVVFNHNIPSTNLAELISHEGIPVSILCTVDNGDGYDVNKVRQNLKVQLPIALATTLVETLQKKQHHCLCFDLSSHKFAKDKDFWARIYTFNKGDKRVKLFFMLNVALDTPEYNFYMTKRHKKSRKLATCRLVMLIAIFIGLCCICCIPTNYFKKQRKMHTDITEFVYFAHDTVQLN